MKISSDTIDALVEIIAGDNIRFPYRSGPKIIDFFTPFGFVDEYSNAFGSRKNYIRYRLFAVNGSPKMKEVILSAIDPRHYIVNNLKVEDAVNCLNQYLVFDGFELVKDGIRYKIKQHIDGSTNPLNPVKNIIFAANGPKPEIVLVDAITNDIKITKNEQYCLVYDRDIDEHGLMWSELVSWWGEKNGLQGKTKYEQALNLYFRLLEAVPKSSEPERNLFKYYYSYFVPRLEDKLPALIPQVYLHYDPYTLVELVGEKRLIRQRMDFLLLLPHDKRIVIEVDGVQHYSKDGKPEPSLYAEMVSEDRRLKLAGYEIFRFGGYELNTTAKAEPLVKAFFESLFKREKLEVENKR